MTQKSKCCRAEIDFDEQYPLGPFNMICTKCCKHCDIAEPQEVSAQNTPEIVHKSDDMPKECAEKKKMTWESLKRNLLAVNWDLDNATCNNCSVNFKKLVEIIESLLSAKDQEFRKTLNSGRKMYQLGRQEGAKEERKKILEKIKKERGTWIKNSVGYHILSSLEEDIRFFN